MNPRWVDDRKPRQAMLHVNTEPESKLVFSRITGGFIDCTSQSVS